MHTSACGDIAMHALNMRLRGARVRAYGAGMPGDGESRSRVIEAHLPLVQSIARRYATRGEPLEDLVQVGTIGLIKAVDRFDPSRGRKLAALARPSIESEIRHHLRDRASVLRVPRTEHEAAAGRGESAAVQAVALREELVPGRDDAEAVEAHLLLQTGAAALNERERRLLHLRYVDDLSQAEIAGELGLSQAHVSRLLRAAVDHLRSELGEGQDGEAPPAPTAGRRSGRVLLRIPQSLHGALAAAAEREGVPLNTFIAGSLASAVGWRDPDGELRPRGARRRGTLQVVNAIVIALAAMTGLALLLVAWLG
jgi:RNA polymerase sigma-B factor